MELADYIIGLVLFSMVILGVSSYIGSLGGDYSKDIDTDMNSTYSQMSVISETTKTIQNETIGENAELSWTTFGNLIFKGPVRAVKLVGESLGVAEGIATDAQKTGYIPSWYAQGIFAIISITVLFLIIGAIIKWKVTS